nr:hypothetical protein [uncultured Dyadobacter sp.]
MNNLPLDPNDDTHAEGKPDEAFLSEYVKKMETEQNLEELARRLGNEWRESPEAQPDLSFDTFEKKREQADRQ